MADERAPDAVAVGGPLRWRCSCRRRALVVSAPVPGLVLEFRCEHCGDSVAYFPKDGAS